MNPSTPVGGVPGLSIPNQPGERRRRDQGAAEQFRRALQQEAAAAPPQGATDGPAASALQPARPAGRREPGAPAHHVDVVA